MGVGGFFGGALKKGGAPTLVGLATPLRTERLLDKDTLLAS
jgi:hypothetical protein